MLETKESPAGVQKNVRNSLGRVSGVSQQSFLRLRRLFRDCFGHFFMSEKLQNESFPKISNFRPEFLSEFSPNFLRSFRASFRGKRRPEKIHQKFPPFFNAKFPGKYEKNIHKMFLERRQSKFCEPERHGQRSNLHK